MSSASEEAKGHPHHMKSRLQECVTQEERHVIDTNFINLKNVYGTFILTPHFRT